jgi:predicted NBD/HSP70 family sugar kinase
MISKGFKMVNHDLMRNINTREVFECIRMNNPITKKQLQNMTKLSWGSISKIINILIEKDLISEQIISDMRVGRSPTVYDVNSEDNYIIGLDINLAGFNGVVIDLKCRVKAIIRESLNRYEEKEILEKAINIIHRLIAMVGGKDKIHGIGIAFPGIVDPIQGTTFLSHNSISSQEFDIGNVISDTFDLPVKIDQDPNCLALTEINLGKARGINTAIVLRASHGIGASLIIGGKVHHGFTGSTGELGHINVEPDSKITCSCGKRGCLETVASIETIVKSAVEGYNNNEMPILAGIVKNPKDITFDVCMKSVYLGDYNMQLLMQNALKYLSIAIANLVKIFDPQLVIMGGKFSKYIELVSSINKMVNEQLWDNMSVLIVSTDYDDDAVCIGAALLLMEDIIMDKIS